MPRSARIEPIAIVTGANRGIGHATALGLARQGWYVILMCRDREAADRTAEQINREVDRDATDVIEVNLASQTSIRNAAAVFLGRHQKLNALINNAAIGTRKQEFSDDGIELQFAVNHLAPFLLTHLLLGVITQSAPARVITVASGAHYRGEIHFADVGLGASYHPMRAYRQSKLANVLFALELSRRLEGSGVTSNCLHPGVIATNLLGALSGLPPWLRWVLRPFTVSPERGSATTLKLATDPSLSQTNGLYFDNGASKMPSTQAQDRAIAQKLWSLSEEMTGTNDHDR